MYEHRHQKPISPRHFMRRLILHGFGSLALVAASLLGGMIGYHSYESLLWRDAFLNAAMLLGGKVPFESPQISHGIFIM